MTPQVSLKNKFIAERIDKVPVSGLHRFFGIAASMPEVISLGVGEPDDIEQVIDIPRDGECFFSHNLRDLGFRAGAP